VRTYISFASQCQAGSPLWFHLFRSSEAREIRQQL
jgi:hypothetical protein